MTIAALVKTNTFVDGTTAVAAEVNTNFDECVAKINELQAVLGNVSASPTELNYLDGVTSAIQTQLDGKWSPETATSIGKHTLWISGEDWYPRTTNGANDQAIQLSNGAVADGMESTTSLGRYAQTCIVLPKSTSVATQITAKLYYIINAANVTGGTWVLSCKPCSNDEALTLASPTSTNYSTALYLNKGGFLYTQTQSFVIAALAKEDLIIFDLNMKANASTYFVGMHLEYTTEAGTDS